MNKYRTASLITDSLESDVGCYIHDTCLDCPLVHCVLDVRFDVQLARGVVPHDVIKHVMQSGRRDSTIITALNRKEGENMLRDGKSIELIAQFLGISRKPVSRWSRELKAI